MVLVDEKQFYENLKSYDNILFLCHRNADADSAGSAYALWRLFGGTIGVQDSMSTMASMLCDRLKVNVVIRPKLSNYDIVVVVDTSNLVQTGYKEIKKFAVIDHHKPGDLIGACELALSRMASSTSELVYSVYMKNGISLDSDVAFALVLAVVTDTGHFRYAQPDVFDMVGEMLRSGGINYADISEFLSQVPVDLSCRIAMLKAASRLNLTRSGDFLIADTKVSSFGAQSATSLISLGADVVFVGSEKEGEKRISGRVRRGIDLDLSALLAEVGTKFGGSGGGHAAAAGVVIKGDLDKALKECVSMAEKALTGLRPQPQPRRPLC
ncbi:exopolyphosphatase [Methanocella sp. CWC-04]|uniref:Exopolyphosphatase n=1 Tax=Methanooceanicella nereidis TaxID=2052831 RepID=A0AAP2RBI1_9EURY|nr:DHH family phosphoesterase [Methanocella sp. CWC-04]MCD1294526.1 exopolyphosphatase [Methanocella sp. CWC-04]